MEPKRVILTNKFKGGESVVDYVIGYYISVSPSINYIIPIFNVLKVNNYVSKVMINYHNSAMWINVLNKYIFVGGENRGIAKEKQKKLEEIKK